MTLRDKNLELFFSGQKLLSKAEYEGQKRNYTCISVHMPKDLLSEIRSIKNKYGYKTMSETARLLITWGLETEELEDL